MVCCADPYRAKAIIVAPTRELAQQIEREINKVAAGLRLHVLQLRKSNARCAMCLAAHARAAPL